MFSCDLSGPLLSSLARLENLSVIDLSNNHLSSPVPETFAYFKSLTNLRLVDYNSFVGAILSAKFEELVNLDHINLENNFFTGIIPSSIFTLPSLNGVFLSNNKFEGQLNDFINGSSRVRSLRLSDNNLEGPIPMSLFQITNLQDLILSSNNNNLNSFIPSKIDKYLIETKFLSLASNNFQGNIPESICNAPYLLVLDLSNNALTGTIPKCLIAMNGTLSILDLGWNKINGTIDTSPGKLKILTIFTTIDLSCNKFEGLIPEGLGQLNALHILNLSHNAFFGQIPLTLGNMKDLECLDLSNNNLSGKIPTQITALSFLSFLNLSGNHLVGRIPTGTQIQSFTTESFKGNDGLCGPPLSPNCGDDRMQGTPPPASNSNVDTKNSIDWNFISSELGFTFGIGTIILPLIFCKAWRIRYWKCIDGILYHTFPQLDFVHERRGRQSYRTLRWISY
uniref:LRR receptor-like serine/threonine-protein kinase GSO1 n=1 Tax=Cajanus cajan TaxID=3821 RepID=A0A151QPY4_CAJCA|nr:LRR receptor-like serine/threonine-protein kinase GSO1 [Cajanus cajan]